MLTVLPEGNEAVGKEGAVSLQPGWAAEARGLSWLEVMEVSSATAAARGLVFLPFGGLAPLDALRRRVLQPGDT